MINIIKLKRGDIIKSLEGNPKKGIKKDDIFKVYLTGHTFGEDWADIINLDGNCQTSISVGFDDEKWELV